ncbi:MAG: hypothetical protein RL264_1547 [Bacteroidota bacterium]|jgi:cytidine deaminase
MTEKYHFEYSLLSNWKELEDEDKMLVEKAFEAMEIAYAPYSKFRVGAAALLENNEIVKGNNQENVAYPSGICAERVALFYAGANFPDQKILKLAIVARGELMRPEQLLSPCGGCRQVMLESENRQNRPIKVILVNQDARTIVVNSVADLLPFGFGISKT